MNKYVEMYLKLYHSIKEKHKLDTKTKAATFMLVILQNWQVIYQGKF